MITNFKRKLSESYHKHKSQWYFYPALAGLILYEVATKGGCAYLAYQSFKRPSNSSPVEVSSRNNNVGLDSLVFNTQTNFVN